MRNAILWAAFIATASSLSAGQTYQVLYSFGTNGGSLDGWFPEAGLVSDGAGNLYGTTVIGGTNVGGNSNDGCIDGCGTVFELSSLGNGQWTETVLYSFCTTLNTTNCPDGAGPESSLIADKNGNLYGTTESGGVNGGGTAFELSPSGAGKPWVETVLYTFRSTRFDGTYPTGGLVFDKSGNLYGTTTNGGIFSHGTVFELQRVSGGWVENILYNFAGPPSDGENPSSGVVFDSSGNLYGATRYGGEGCEEGCGTVFELSPSSDGTWTETILHGFSGRQVYPWSVSLAGGSLYGTYLSGGGKSSGGVFRLTPRQGVWSETAFMFDGADGAYPESGVLLDEKSKTLYSTTGTGGLQDDGTIFQIKGSSEEVLYSFCGEPNCEDGVYPATYGSLIEDSEGNLYGVTGGGGTFNQGVVFELTP